MKAGGPECELNLNLVHQITKKGNETKLAVLTGTVKGVGLGEETLTWHSPTSMAIFVMFLWKYKRAFNKKTTKETGLSLCAKRFLSSRL